MKKTIHPQYVPNATISCACGNVLTTGSTLKEIKVEICSHCHPFYTGKQKLIDTARRVEKFQERQTRSSAVTTAGTAKKARKKAVVRTSSDLKKTLASLKAATGKTKASTPPAGKKKTADKKAKA